MEHDIQKLLDLYFDGKTTTQQEQQLRAYFLGNPVKENWMPYKSLFVGFQSSKKEKFTQAIDLPKKSRYVFWWVSAAIVATFIVGGNLYKPTQSYSEQEAYASYAEFKENEIKMKEDWKVQAAEMLEAAGCKDVTVFDSKAPIGRGIHEMGTARMGRDPKTSVLNKFNQVHKVPNVFVTDGACMTSAANQNPSLTYMALTARAANHAINELKKMNL